MYFFQFFLINSLNRGLPRESGFKYSEQSISPSNTEIIAIIGEVHRINFSRQISDIANTFIKIIPIEEFGLIGIASSRENQRAVHLTKLSAVQENRLIAILQRSVPINSSHGFIPVLIPSLSQIPRL